MKIDVFDLNGNPIQKIDIPKVFEEKVRRDLIQRAVLSSQSKRIQPIGRDPYAGKGTSAHYHGYRRHRYAMMGKEMARMPRIHGKSPPHLSMRPRFVPQTRGGRLAHPPKVEKIWEQKINKKEKRKAIISALSATSNKELVEKRGHKVSDIKQLPLVVDDQIQQIKKTKDVIEFLKKMGLERELERMRIRKVRAGKGKTRGRVYKIRKGPLLIITEDKGIIKAVKNIPGMDICKIQNLSTENLAPGAMPGRLTIFSRSAFEKINTLFK